MAPERRTSSTGVYLGVFMLLIGLSAQILWAQESRAPFTVADSFDWREIITSYSDPVLVSPDRKSYVLVLQQPDLSQNGSWIEFYIGSLGSFDEARPVRVARVFTRSKEETMSLAMQVQWTADSRHITFILDDGQFPARIMSFDVQKRRMAPLTRNKAPIQQYALSEDGKTLFYTVLKPQTRLAACDGGTALTDESIWSLLACDAKFGDGLDRRAYATFVLDVRTGSQRVISDPDLFWFATPELLVSSPDGRYALAVEPSPGAPAEWDAYTDHLLKDNYFPAARRKPKGPHLLRRFVVMDSVAGTSRPLWNAPQNPYAYAVWSPDSTSVVLGPTFMPPEISDATGLAGHAVGIVDLSTGKITQLPIGAKDMPPNGYQPVRWTKAGVIELADADEYRPTSGTLRFKQDSSGWHRISEGDPNRKGGLAIEVRQDYNTPPRLFAVDQAKGREEEIFNPNPGFTTRFRLAKAELIHWVSTDKKPWSGVLYAPPGCDKGHRCPLVIQTHGYLKDKFSLTGGYTTVFAAQPLATSGIAVVQLGGPDKEDAETLATPEEPEVTLRGIEGVIAYLSAEGFVDKGKVGVIGFSRTGWHVEYILTHSKAEFAAAEIADSMDASYFEYLLNGDQFESELEQDVGAAPFGDGLQVWFQKAPVFNAQRIGAPLRMELDSSPLSQLLAHWDLFVALRRLHKPVEYFAIPDVNHGVHVLQNPVQRLASQGGSVDWFRFWLQGYEDPDPAKVGQYSRWRELRKLQEQNEQAAGRN